MKKKYTKADGNFVIISSQRPRDRAPMEWRDEICKATEVEPAKYYSTREEAQTDADKINAWCEAQGKKFKYVVKDVSPKTPDTRRKTCQICARPILANTGTIAHHGYTVKWGFFSGTCEGSLALPYEQDRSVLGKHIDRVKVKLAGEKAWLETLTNSNPVLKRVERIKTDIRFKYEEKLVEYTPDHINYARVKVSIVYETESNIRHLTRYIDDQQVRYDNWKAKVLV